MKVAGTVRSGYFHQLIGLGAIQSVPAGSAIMIEGTRPDVIYVLLAGRIRIHADGKCSRPFGRQGDIIWAKGSAQFSCSMHTAGALLSIDCKTAASAGLLSEFARDALSQTGLNVSGTDRAPHDLISAAQMLRGLEFDYGLDLGCGGGRLTALLTTCSSMTVMLDADHKVFTDPITGMAPMNDDALSRVCARFETLPFGAGSFGLVASRLALHESSSHQQALKEVRRVLRLGGAFLVIDVVPPSLREAAEVFDAFELALDAEYTRPPNELEWRNLLETNGFRIARIARTEVHRELAQRPAGEENRTACVAVARGVSRGARKGLRLEFAEDKLTWRDQRVVIMARAV